jgi:hypothetical protein
LGAKRYNEYSSIEELFFLWLPTQRHRGFVQMVVTLAIDEPLASRLQAKAAARQVSPEEFARALLGEALQQMDDAETWEGQNQRRITLIRKSSVEALTEAEQAELQWLQNAADQRLEARDRELLAQLDRFKHAVAHLPSATETT